MPTDNFLDGDAESCNTNNQLMKSVADDSRAAPARQDESAMELVRKKNAKRMLALSRC